MTVREALVAVVKEATGGFAEYAKPYAQAGLDLGGSEDADVITEGNTIMVVHQKTGKMMIGEELKVQILYVLSNLQGWRGDRAKEVKEVLKKASK